MVIQLFDADDPLDYLFCHHDTTLLVSNYAYKEVCEAPHKTLPPTAIFPNFDILDQEFLDEIQIERFKSQCIILNKLFVN